MAHSEDNKHVVIVEHAPGCRCPSHRGKNQKGPHRPGSVILTIANIQRDHKVELLVRKCKNNYHHQPHHKRWWTWLRGR